MFRKGNSIFQWNIIVLSLIFILAVVVTANPPSCNYNGWKNCIGKNKPCPCFDKIRPNQHLLNTLEKRVAQEYADIVFERRYNDAALIFADDMVTHVPGFGLTFTGKISNLAYLHLGDPDVSDQFLIIDSEIKDMRQELKRVYINIDQTLRQPILGNEFVSSQVWIMDFNDIYQIQEMTIMVDTYLIATKLSIGHLLNISDVCYNIQSSCQGTNQQFDSVEDCQEFMDGLPLTNPDGTVFPQGNTVGCRAWHEINARTLPEIHCIHAGPQVIDPFVTPCNDWV